MGRKSKKQIAAEAAAKNPASPASPAVPSAIVLTPEQNAQLDILRQTQAYIVEYCLPHILEERRLRAAFVASVTPTPVEGTLTVELGGGWRVKLVTAFKRKLDRAQFPAVFGALPAGTADTVLDWTPRLVKAGYDALAPEHRAILDQCVTTEPQAAQVRILPPGDMGQPETTDE